MNAEFNLLDEKWIRVMLPDCSMKEVSLTDALINAHMYRDLAGETKAQDVAVLRLLLAVLHTVFSRVNADGESDPLEKKQDAFDRWAELWKRKQFPEEPIRQYLEQYRDRFYLFHPEFPFYQIPEASNGTHYSAAKLNGEISESNRKFRLFSSRSGELHDSLTYSESARWILYVNAYDDTSSKTTGKNLPSISVGWLGSLGIVTVSGGNLFKTLMLNLTLLQDGEKVWGKNIPVWELKEPHREERKEIPLPDNPAELLTLQSRRIILDREGEKVTGYSLQGGDFFPKENAFTEQMTIWKTKKNKKTGDQYFLPVRHDPAKQAWRDFSCLAVQKDDSHIPGVISWITKLREKNILPEEEMIQLNIASVQYGMPSFYITDVFDDSMSFEAVLLAEKGNACQELVLNEIKRCEETAGYIDTLARDLVWAVGGGDNEEKTQRKRAEEKFFYRLDVPFRKWLSGLDFKQDDEAKQKKAKEWNDIVDRIARKLGMEMVEEAGPIAFTGRKNKNTGKYYSASSALNWFNYQMAKQRRRDE